jgi:hypothetical protein
MLKIRDDVDLKELEKFGFKPKYSEDTGNIIAYERYKYDKRYEDIRIIKYEKVRTFRIFRTPTKKIEWRINPYDTYFDLDLIYDLIQAGLVEKVRK